MTEAEKAYQYFVVAVPENEEQAKAYFWARKALQPTLTPQNELLTCEGCAELGKWENEYEYGFPSPCTGCKRRAYDNYCLPPERQGGDADHA